ncbi:MAG: hypothetical protein U0441_10605 [Polyangiaceae bacterium]
MRATSGIELFEQVVALTGLASWVGPGLVQRALTSQAGVAKEAANVEHYRRALPQIRARMAAYVAIDEVDRRVKSIEQHLGPHTSMRP